MSSFHTLARWVSDLPVQRASLVVVGPLRHDQIQVSAERAAQLHSDLSNLVAAAAPLTKARNGTALDLSEARRLARTTNLPLLHLAPSLSAGGLKLEAHIIEFAHSFWQKARAPLGSTIWQGSREAPMDAMLRRYLPESRWSPRTVSRWRLPVTMPLALSCTASAGTTKIVVVGRTEIALAEKSADGLRTLRKVNWKDLSPVAPAPLRAPLGAVNWEAEQIRVGSSDRAHSLLLDERLGLVDRKPRSYPLGEGQCAPFTSRGLADAMACNAPFSNPSAPDDASEWDATLVATFVEADGALTELSAKIALGSTTLQLRVSGPTWGTREYDIKEVGGPLAFFDINGDGRVELVSTSSSANKRDALILNTLAEEGPVEVARIETPPLRAFSVCPFSGASPNHVLIATDTELWEIRP